MKNIQRTAPILVILAAIFTGPATAGVVFQIEITDHQASPATVNLIEISAEGKQLAAELAVTDAGSEGRVIYRGDRREMVIVDHTEKSYFALDQKQVTAMAGQVSQAMKQMEEALKDVPEAQRAAVEEMMKTRMPQQAAAKGPQIEVKKTGERAEKNGYPCVRYDVLKDGRKINELWVTEWENIDGATEVADAFTDMGDFVRELTQAFSAAMGGASIGPKFGQEMFGQLSKLGGFPVSSREFAEDGSLRAESNLRSAKRHAIAPGAFDPPADYKLNSMFGG